MKTQNADVKNDVNALNLLNEMVIKMAKVVDNSTKKSVDGMQIFKNDYTSSNENSTFEIEFSEKLDEKLNLLTKEIAKIRYQHDQDLALTIENDNALDVNEVNENNFFNAREERAQNKEALNMKNQDRFDSNNINTLNKSTFKKHAKREGIESFELELSSNLNIKLQNVIQYFEDFKGLTHLGSVEKVIMFGISRCHLMSYWQFKTDMFMQSEVFKNIEIEGDAFCYAMKNWDIDDDIKFKYKNYLLRDRVSDYEEELKLIKNFENADEINAFNITLAGNLKSQFLDLSEIWLINYGISEVKTLEYAIRVGINYVYELVIDDDYEEVFNINDMIDSVFSYDQY
jgi:hypothetical protein